MLEEIDALGSIISSGFDSFFKSEVNISLIYMGCLSLVILLFVDYLGQSFHHFRCYATVAFLMGGSCSLFASFISSRIGCMTNFRGAYMARNGLNAGFKTLYRGGLVIGFTTAGILLASLLSLLLCYWSVAKDDPLSYEQKVFTLMLLVSAYGLGASCLAIFGRVGGGVYSKAADVSCELIGKVDVKFKQQSIINPATIADIVGDATIEITGTQSDMFGSLAEVSCAILVLLSCISDMNKHFQVFLIPMMVIALGIYSNIFTSILVLFVYRPDTEQKLDKVFSL